MRVPEHLRINVPMIPRTSIGTDKIVDARAACEGIIQLTETSPSMQFPVPNDRGEIIQCFSGPTIEMLENRMLLMVKCSGKDTYTLQLPPES